MYAFIKLFNSQRIEVVLRIYIVNAFWFALGIF